jgi:hypothetical protein
MDPDPGGQKHMDPTDPDPDYWFPGGSGFIPPRKLFIEKHQTSFFALQFRVEG